VKADRVVSIFNDLFQESHITALTGGETEPFYRVGGENEHGIFFREDFVASALHEVSHWCLAGPSRRAVNDYGYWYSADRDKANQLKFEAVEARPQALEWIFSVAAGVSFRLSADNLTLKDHDLSDFGRQVKRHVDKFLLQGLPPRARLFANALAGLEVDYTQRRHYEGLTV